MTDNMCMLSFDEMSIRKNLTYNSKLDQIEGYQDHAGQGRSAEIACKALTFMAIGLRKNWKQPIAFYFSGAYVTSDRLAALIKEVGLFLVYLNLKKPKVYILYRSLRRPTTDVRRVHAPTSIKI